MVNKKRAAMEMSVGTIVTIVLLMSALVLGLVLTRNIFKSTTDNVDSIDDQVKGEIQNLFGSEGDKLVVSLGGKNTATVKQGTENFGIPFGFAPDNPQAWGSAKTNCKYAIKANPGAGYCISKGWTNPTSSIVTGTTAVTFDQVDQNNGYALMKINIPEYVPPCLQRFSITVTCSGAQFSGETTTGYFDLEVVKRGLF